MVVSAEQNAASKTAAAKDVNAYKECDRPFPPEKMKRINAIDKVRTMQTDGIVD